MRAKLVLGAALLWAPAQAKEPQAVEDTVRALMAQEKHAEAYSAAQAATESAPESVQAAYLLGRTAFYLGKDAEAKAALDRAITLDHRYADAWFFRGLVQQQLGAMRPAAADFAQAAKLAPGQWHYWFELGKQRQRIGDGPGALEALRRSLKGAPPGPAARANQAVGAVLADQGDHPGARAAWEAAVLLDAKNVDAHYNLGVWHQVRGDAQKALSHYRAAHALAPGDPSLAKKVVQAHYRLDQLDQAGAARARYLELSAASKDPKVRDQREFCFDQFEVPGGRVFAYETLKKEGRLVYWYTFKVVQQGNVVRTINLERSDAVTTGGHAFVLGRDEGGVHTTFDVFFKAMPPYPELRGWVRKANAGELTGGTRSRRAP